MGSYLNPSNKGFRESLASEIYVDKTLLICSNFILPFATLGCLYFL